MYVGHVGVALGAKRYAPAAAMTALVTATYLPDWTDAALCLSGKYHDAQMYSHSLPAMVVMAFVAAGTQGARGRGRRAALIVGLVVVTHVLLDYLTGIKPSWPGGPIIGLGLYNHPIVDFLMESVLIILGWLLYNATLPAMRKRWNDSHLMLVLLIGMQVAVDVGRLLAPSINKC